jgi:hypothetical protein
MAYQPWPQGQIDPMFLIPLALDSGPENLTGAVLSDFSLYFRNTSVYPSDTLGTGQLALFQHNPGMLLYKLSPTDVTSAVTESIQIRRTLTTPGGSEIVYYDAIPFTISLS